MGASGSASSPRSGACNGIVSPELQEIRRGLTWTRCKWTFGLGAIGGLLFVLSHGLRKIQPLLEHRISPGNLLAEAGVAVAATIVMAFLLLLALNAVEHGNPGHPPAWTRYALATLGAVGGATLLVHALAPYIPIAALSGWYLSGPQPAIDSFVFSNSLLFGGLATFVYVRLLRARQSQSAFERAELERAAARREVLTAQLAAAQAQVEPGFLFNTLHQVEALYDRDSASGDRMLDDLIAYLRAALPQLRGEDSTLARESTLAEAYLRIVQGRMGSRLEFALDIPAALGARHFPPMLLLPMVERAVRDGLEPLPHGGRLEIRATSLADRLRLTVSDNGLGDATELRESQAFHSLRERVAQLYGGGGTLTVGSNRPSGVTATFEVPFA